MTDTRPSALNASGLREAFDRSFALPPRPNSEATVDLLQIRTAGDRFAIRVGDLTAVVADRKIVPVPSSAPALLGLAGIRGGIVPVFRLSSLLGLGEADSVRWMVLIGQSDPLAFAFAHLEGHLRLPRVALHMADESRRENPYLGEVAKTDSGLLPVIGVAALAAVIRERPVRQS